MKTIKMKSVETSRPENSVMSKFKITNVAAAVITLLCVSLPSSYASDIEIYTKPSTTIGSGVVVMMLDTSGSMSLGAAGESACDLPLELDKSRTIRKADELASGGYRREYCYFSSGKSIKSYSYYKNNTQWYECPIGTVNKTNKCFVKMENVPDIKDFESEMDGRTQYFYKNLTTQSKFYDRMSKLKDALYVLATMPVYDSSTESGKKGIKKNVKIGLGTYPYIGRGYDINKKGYIRIPAKEWGEVGSAQRKAVINFIQRSDFTGNGGTPTSAAYAEAAAYLLGTTTGNDEYSGIGHSKAENDTLVQGFGNGMTYISPLDKSSEAAECSGQGIYFLTDGEPQTPGPTTTVNLMAKALGLSRYTFTNGLTGGANDGVNLGSNYGGNAKSDWQAISSFAKSLNDPQIVKIALNVQEEKRRVLTAVVGFGSVFQDPNSVDGKNARAWGLLEKEGGVYGKGGFIAATESDQVVQSLNDFIGQVSGTIPSISTGTSTIPLDELNPSVVQPYSYFPQFEPKIKDEDSQQVWFGNLKKYYVLNNGVYSSNKNPSNNTVVVKKSQLQDLADIWVDGSINYPENHPVYRKHGALNRLILGTTTAANGQKQTGRTLLTDYVYDGTKSANDRISRNLNLVQIQHTYTTDNKTKTDKIYAKALMGLLGYIISNDTESEGLDLSNQSPSLRQMGSIYHSKPLLLTQSGKAEAVRDPVTKKISVGSTNREDYVLFGTTQGLVQVVDAATGIEKFAFVPKEIILNQSETFKQGSGNLVGGKDALYYGMDGEWTAHTVYVTKSDGTLTVKGVSRDVLGSSDLTEDLKGKQWVYGGMRMGGRSYYALDLTDINSPKVKFHIDPSSGKVYSLNNPEGKAYDALSNMGQSWSKPTIGYVNWKGQRKLVMIVGGGYDAGGNGGDGLKEATTGIRTGYAGYEGYNYKQSNKIGAGVYMFDADTGDLLWNADSNSNADLKYSVVSQIRAIDRNNDGIIDHLYFGDLAGQAFRVDLKNDGGANFTTQINRILNVHENDGTSPRFYTMPAFTAHYSAGSSAIFGGNTVVVTFVSGNQSSPLLATTDSPQKKNSLDLKYDAAYAIFDYDVYPSTAAGRYPSTRFVTRNKLAAKDEAAGLAKLRYINEATTATTIDETSGWGGWYYQFNTKIDGKTKKEASVIKGLTTPLALEGSLYVTQYDASDNGTTSSCGAGVKGHSFTQRLCLPGGVCKDGAKYVYNLGSGIVTPNVGSDDKDPNKRSLVVPDPEDICPPGQTCKPEGGETFLKTGGALRFIPNRWYERYTQ